MMLDGRLGKGQKITVDVADETLRFDASGGGGAPKDADQREPAGARQ
jgi:hypothetical protein